MILPMAKRSFPSVLASDTDITTLEHERSEGEGLHRESAGWRSLPKLLTSAVAQSMLSPFSSTDKRFLTNPPTLGCIICCSSTQGPATPIVRLALTKASGMDTLALPTSLNSGSGPTPVSNVCALGEPGHTNSVSLSPTVFVLCH